MQHFSVTSGRTIEFGLTLDMNGTYTYASYTCINSQVRKAPSLRQ